MSGEEHERRPPAPPSARASSPPGEQAGEQRAASGDEVRAGGDALGPGVEADAPVPRRAVRDVVGEQRGGRGRWTRARVAATATAAAPLLAPHEEAAVGPARGERIERRLVRALVEELRPRLLLRPAHRHRPRGRRSAPPCDVGSLRSPTRIASVGQTTTQAGSRPTSSRCAQKLHFSAEWSSGLMKIAS